MFVLTDSLDGVMARQAGRSGPWGAFLDSTLDRFGDGAIFAGLVLWFTADGDDQLTAVLALACLVLGSIVPYARARAEGLGMTASGGIAERADRLVLVLVATGLVGFGVPASCSPSCSRCSPSRRPSRSCSAWQGVPAGAAGVAP